MIRFLKESIRELRHVVWPTKKETRNFFGGVWILIIAFTIYLFIASSAFSNMIFAVRDALVGIGGSGANIDVADVFIDENPAVETNDSTASGETTATGSQMNISGELEQEAIGETILEDTSRDDIEVLNEDIPQDLNSTQ